MVLRHYILGSCVLPHVCNITGSLMKNFQQSKLQKPRSSGCGNVSMETALWKGKATEHPGTHILSRGCHCQPGSVTGGLLLSKTMRLYRLTSKAGKEHPHRDSCWLPASLQCGPALLLSKLQERNQSTKNPRREGSPYERPWCQGAMLTRPFEGRKKAGIHGKETGPSHAGRPFGISARCLIQLECRKYR